jgi:WXXGXW repeat (2 copies)
MRIIASIRSLLFALMMLSISAISSAQVLVSVNFGPPALPIYEQPLCPSEGYIWAPGYWAWNPAYGYFWVPGTWVLAPEPGLLWTPGYWAFDDGLYYWHPGYWGPTVGYYGGIAYGYGYPGSGYYGGYWRGRQFYYNQTVNNVNVTNIHNVYNRTVVNNASTGNRVSFNGGPGGTTARPTSEQEAAARQRRVPPVSAQIEHEQSASTNRELLASVNQGRPPIAATPRPAEFSARGAVAASHAGAPYKAPENRPIPPQSSSSAPRPNNRPENNRLPRPETEPGRPAPRPEVPRPPSASERENTPRGENNPHPPREARPENAPYPREVPSPNRDAHPDRRTPPDKVPPPPNGRQDRPL